MERGWMETYRSKADCLSDHRPILFRPEGDDSASIQMRKIVKTYKTAAGDVDVLKGINADFYEGEFVSLVGKSGSGKSTLVNMLTGIDRPTSGFVRIQDVLINELDESEMARWRGRNLGIIFQFYQLLPMLSLLENTLLPMDITNQYPPAEREWRALELLERVGLKDFAHKMPAAVSGGQQQAAAIARSLANDPPFIIADEPTGNLDSKTAESVIEIFESLVEQGKTIVMVTHDPSLAKRTTRTMLISDGEIIHPALSKALPMLSHPQLLKATHQLDYQKFHPGEPIIRQGDANHTFHIVTSGQARVQVERSDGSHVFVTCLPPGSYFGEIEMIQNKPAIASIVADPENPVEVITLGKEAFESLYAQSPALQKNLQRIIQERMSENIAVKELKPSLTAVTNG
jgi:ABC-type lipoprotein export system ATPase subunit